MCVSARSPAPKIWLRRSSHEAISAAPSGNRVRSKIIDFTYIVRVGHCTADLISVLDFQSRTARNDNIMAFELSNRTCGIGSEPTVSILVRQRLSLHLLLIGFRVALLYR